MKQREPKRALPELEWPWCDVCAMHVREVGGVRHVCALRLEMQDEPRQLALPLGGAS